MGQPEMSSDRGLGGEVMADNFFFTAVWVLSVLFPVPSDIQLILCYLFPRPFEIYTEKYLWVIFFIVESSEKVHHSRLLIKQYNTVHMRCMNMWYK